MRRSPSENSIGVQAGKNLEVNLLGRPNKFDNGIEVSDDFRSKNVPSLIRDQEARLMDLTRENQSDSPRAPKKPFLRKLASDIDQKLLDAGFPEQYEVRVYSAVGTALDMAGIDFWVELYDEDLGRTLSTYKIDLKSNPQGHKGALADAVYFVDFEVASSDNREAIYEQPEYTQLVQNVTSRFESEVEKIANAIKERRDRVRHIRYTEDPRPY